jgi:hypothetical protein
MRIKSLFGLPAHVLLVHIPIILVPLVAFGAVLILWPSLRRRFGWALVVLAAVAAGSTVLAEESGKALQRYVKRTDLVRQHTHIGENLKPWTILLFLFVLATVAWDWWTRRQASDASHELQIAGRSLSASTVQRLGLGLSAIAVVVAGVSGYWVYRIGHSGAKASWTVVQKRIDAGNEIGGEGREGR